MRPAGTSVKNQVIKFLNDGFSERQVAQKVGISRSTVNGIRNKWALGVVKSQGGRISKLSNRDKALCVRMVVRDGLKTAVEVKNALEKDLGKVFGVSTVHRGLKELGLTAVVKPKKPLLSTKNVKARLAWAKAHKDWTLDDWKRVIWSDEAKVNRFGSDGLHWAWIRDGERVQPKHVKQTVKHGGGNIMVWGCITYGGVGYMTKIDTILDKDLYKKILEEDLEETIAWYG